MADRATETDKLRMPQQHVREGRGEPGYLGDVEVYKTPVPDSLATTGKVAKTMPTAVGTTSEGATTDTAGEKPKK